MESSRGEAFGADSPPTERGPAPQRAPVTDTPAGNKKSGVVEQLRIIGGLAALLTGLLALVGVLAIAVIAGVDSDQLTQLATTVIGVIGSIVGAYFGVKIGTDGTQKALENQRDEAARSQIFAAHLPPELAEKALDLAFSQKPAPTGTTTAPPKTPPAAPPRTGR